MSEFYEVSTNGNPSQAVGEVFGNLLSGNLADVVFASAKTPYSDLPMPFLFTQPDAVKDVSPFAPAAPFNASRQAKSVIRYEIGKRIALAMRPCEIRALIELVKLKQCSLENTILIGIECLGRMENLDYLRLAQDHPDISAVFDDHPEFSPKIVPACQVCTQFLPTGCDMSICHIGLPASSEKILIQAETERGKHIVDQLNLARTTEPEARKSYIEKLSADRLQKRAGFLKETNQKLNAMDKLQSLLGACLNCYNCRVACPVCYCKECVFLTDVFDHPPETLVRRAEKKGKIKLPTDTVMFHLTRLAHMSHACVGCGHCSSVCPSHIPVADIFMTVSDKVQSMFDYIPGMSIADKPPLTVFEQKSHE